MKQYFNKTISTLAIIAMLLAVYSCDDFKKFEPIGANSIADATLPSANFTATQGAGPDEEWKDYTFANTSISATDYSWDFGNGETSIEVDGATTYSGEGMYTVTLTATDGNGVSSTYSETIDVVEPEAPAVPDPTLVNAVFDRLAKSSGSDCTCSGWINRDLGDQGESSTVGGVDGFLKFDNNEPDHVYQEFAVTPNADYTVTIPASFKSIANPPGSFPGSMLEIRVLAGSGYEAGYTPTYYTDTALMPQGNSATGYWGYRTVAQAEDAANNLIVETISNPGNDDYNNITFTFNAGANDSVALFIRGIGGDPAVGNYGYTSGDEEIRADSVTITAIN